MEKGTPWPLAQLREPESKCKAKCDWSWNVMCEDHATRFCKLGTAITSRASP